MKLTHKLGLLEKSKIGGEDIIELKDKVRSIEMTHFRIYRYKHSLKTEEP